MGALTITLTFTSDGWEYDYETLKTTEGVLLTKTHKITAEEDLPLSAYNEITKAVEDMRLKLRKDLALCHA